MSPHYYIVGFIVNNTRWYLSLGDKSTNKQYRAVLGADLAIQFATKDIAISKLQNYLIGKSNIKGTFTYEVSYKPTTYMRTA